MEIPVTVAAVTLSIALPLWPPVVAVMVEVPADTALARPAVTVATAAIDDTQFADEVTSTVEPSL